MRGREREFEREIMGREMEENKLRSPWRKNRKHPVM